MFGRHCDLMVGVATSQTMRKLRRAREGGIEPTGPA